MNVNISLSILFPALSLRTQQMQTVNLFSVRLNYVRVLSQIVLLWHIVGVNETL